MDRVERTFYPDGTLHKEIHYRGDTKHGASRSWHPNGVLAEEYWFDDDPNGKWIDRTWYESGILKSEMSFVMAAKVGGLPYGMRMVQCFIDTMPSTPER